jgi:hypothetical protein
MAKSSLGVILRHPNYDIYPNGISIGVKPEKVKVGNSPLTFSSEETFEEAISTKPQSHHINHIKLKHKKRKNKSLQVEKLDSNFSEPASTKWRFQDSYSDEEWD